MALRSVPPPPEPGDPFDGLVLDQAFVAAAKVYEDRLEVHRDDLGLSPTTMSVIPPLTRRSVITTSLLAVSLFAIMLLMAPAWHLAQDVTRGVFGSTVGGGDTSRSPQVDHPDTDSWTPLRPAELAASPAPTGTAATPAAPAPSPVLRDGELVDPCQDPFGG
jgi:hypothetical protein